MTGIVPTADDEGPGPDPVGPLKGGANAQETSSEREREAIETETGNRSLFVNVLKGAGADKCVVEDMPPDGKPTVSVFTSKSTAILYLQVAEWDSDFEPFELTKSDITAWFDFLTKNGVETVTVNPNRHDQTRGLPQHVRPIRDLGDRPGEEILLMFQELQASNSPARPQSARRPDRT